MNKSDMVDMLHTTNNTMLKYELINALCSLGFPPESILDQLDQLIKESGRSHIRHSLSSLYVLEKQLEQRKNSRIHSKLQELLLKSRSDFKCSVVVACMNRTQNLSTSIKSWVLKPFIEEIIVVDFSSKDPLLENKDIAFLHNNILIKVVRVENEEVFNLGKADNIGFDHCSSNFIIKIDADYVVKDIDFLNRFFSSPDSDNTLLHGDYRFGHPFSGFFVTHRKNLVNFREDLNGYGYDEVDLYARMHENNDTLQDIPFFDVQKYLFHIPHGDNERCENYKNKTFSSSEYMNKSLCKLKSDTHPSRNSYEKRGDSLVYKKQNLNKIFCINLDCEHDRWSKFEQYDFLERVSAVNSKVNPSVIDDFGLELKPVNLTHAIYFNRNDGAVGCYLSHLKIWQRIVDEEIPFSLILEDDIEPKSLEALLDSNIIFQDYEIINLSTRIRWDNNRTLWDGAESYILSYEGARKLIDATNFPKLLDKIIPEVYSNIQEEDFISFCNKPSIVTPVDKFMGYCCEENANDLIRLNYNLYPCVSLTHEAEISYIKNAVNDVNVWDLDSKQLSLIISQLT